MGWSHTGLERLRIASSRTLSLDLEQARSKLAHLAGLSVLRSTTSCSELKRSWAPMPSLQEQTSARECKRAAVVPLWAAPTPMLFLLLLKVTAQRSCFVEYQHVSLNIVSGHVISLLSITFKSLDAVHLSPL